MMSLLAKSLGWIITSATGLTVAVTAIVLNKSANGSSAIGIHLPILPPHWPPSHNPPPAVPEVNTGLVLLPIVFAVLLFASRQLLRKRA
ncbi:MAG: hypothetical protein WBZ19_05285 [Chthoniobacterales bacterium]